MSKYIGSSAVNLSTTSADVTGNADIDGNLTVGGNLTVSGTTITVDHASAQTVDLGDGDKIRLGADYELQLWSDGTTGQISGDFNHTGSITTDGLTVDGAAAFSNGDTTVSSGDDFAKLQLRSVDSSTNSYGVMSEIADVALSNFDGGSNNHNLVIRTNDGLAATGTLRDRINIARNGDISFYEDTGTTAKFFWDASAESLGIGTSSPSAVLDLVIPSPAATASSGGFEITEGTKTFALSTTGSSYNYAGVGANELWYYGNSNFGAFTFGSDGDVPIKFISNGSERLRITSAGQTLIGRTATSGVSDGHRFDANGFTQHVRDGGSVLELSRGTSDGDIQVFKKGTTTVGSIGVGSSGLTIGKGDTGFRFADGADAINPWNLSSNAARDGAISLGENGGRFKDLYLSGGAYLGGTGASNKLDDYEEGTFSLTIGGVSGGAFGAGKYVKIGALVHFQWYSNGTMSVTNATASFTGLPFTSAPSPYYSVFYAYHNTYCPTSSGGYINVNATSGNFTALNSTTGAPTNGSPGRYLMLAGSYYTNA